MNTQKTRKKYVFLFYIVVAFIATIGFAYQITTQNDSMQMIVKEWSGKEFLLSNAIKEMINSQQIGTQDLSKYIIISYIDSTTCTSCRIRAFGKTIDSLRTVTNRQIRSLLIIDSKTLTDVHHAVEQNGLKSPYVIDVEERILKQNNIPNNDKIRTFLVDSLYRVVLIGNPIVNQNIFKLYVKEIKKG